MMDWRIVGEFPNYSVSEDGQLRRSGHGRFKPSDSPLKGWIDAYGYRCYTFWQDGRKLNRKAHRLVATAFLCPQPSPKHEVCHTDNDRTNNHWSNLRWDTRAGNEADKRVVKKDNAGERHGLAKLTIPIVQDIIRRYNAGGITQQKLADEYGIHQVAVSQLVRGKRWSRALEEAR